MADVVIRRDMMKILASEARISILKSLKKRRKTLTELSKDLDMSVSGVKEHLDKLMAIGLVMQVDENHKWKYYELTKKANSLLQPDKVNIHIILSLVIIGIVGLAIGITNFFTQSAGRLLTAESAKLGGHVSRPSTYPVYIIIFFLSLILLLYAFYLFKKDKVRK